MSVRFVLGRAGTGKTAHCINTIRRLLADSPVDGPRLILLVPEQASFQMERALLAGDSVFQPWRMFTGVIPSAISSDINLWPPQSS